MMFLEHRYSDKGLCKLDYITKCLSRPKAEIHFYEISLR